MMPACELVSSSRQSPPRPSARRPPLQPIQHNLAPRKRASKHADIPLQQPPPLSAPDTAASAALLSQAAAEIERLKKEARRRDAEFAAERSRWESDRAAQEAASAEMRQRLRGATTSEDRSRLLGCLAKAKDEIQSLRAEVAAEKSAAAAAHSAAALAADREAAAKEAARDLAAKYSAAERRLAAAEAELGALRRAARENDAEQRQLRESLGEEKRLSAQLLEGLRSAQSDLELQRRAARCDCCASPETRTAAVENVVREIKQDQEYLTQRMDTVIGLLSTSPALFRPPVTPPAALAPPPLPGADAPTTAPRNTSCTRGQLCASSDAAATTTDALRRLFADKSVCSADLALSPAPCGSVDADCTADSVAIDVTCDISCPGSVEADSFDGDVEA
eukprot:TRINITY_DN11829_c0_g1_i1.p1 TRINITY_DN11829_c0_g1~~TRINITY_DN11829_c0_g1_i1.p1  ORF type:complete len:414 (+),score=127.53 TRINITY_DN11829_c0_g1_i1:64-1242(+)